jgi:hypothetical protein
MEFNGDGTKMFVLQGDFGNPSGMPLYQYSLSTAYNTSTASYDSVFQYIIGIAPANHTGIYGMAFWRDGTGLVATSYPGASGTPSQTTSASFISYDITTINATKRITNGIDINGEGGLVWFKGRDVASHSLLFDTERGAANFLLSSLTNAQASSGAGERLTSFNADGFSLGTDPGSAINSSSFDYASWTFRKQPGFFDVVTYTGTASGAGITIPHNLGSAPGMIIVKPLGQAGNWHVYHRSTGANQIIYLNYTYASSTNAGFFPQTPDANNFYVGSQLNQNDTYVAYIFAHDAQDFGPDSDESIIKCGSWTSAGNAGPVEVNLGWEPQFILWKRSDASTDWVISDNMRGMTADGSAAQLYPNQSQVEGTSSTGVAPTATGFKGYYGVGPNIVGANLIYVAIRRPHKPAEEFAATDLFAIDTSGGTSPTPPRYTSGFPVDLVYQRTNVSATNAGAWWTRLTASLLYPSLTDAESTSSAYSEYFAENEGFQDLTSVSSTNYAWMFRRAPGFFDIVAYTGTGSAQNISHNLNAVPEMLVVKTRSTTGNWMTYHSGLNGGTNPEGYYALINGANAQLTDGSGAVWNNTAPTSSQFSVNTASFVNGSGTTYVAYLFATVPGISKVGSYTGNGGSQTIDCGFSSSARFVFIKRTSDTGNWMFWDSARGITAATNDPFLYLNTTAAQASVSGRDIDPDSSGFALNTNYDWINLSGSEYIFLAIA